MTEEQQQPTLGVRLKEVLHYKESMKMAEKQQGPPLGVQFKEVFAL